MVISGGEAREDCAQPYKDHHGDMDKQGFPFGQEPEPNNPDFRRRFKKFRFPDQIEIVRWVMDYEWRRNSTGPKIAM